MLVRSGGAMTARIFLGLSALLWLLRRLAAADTGGRHA